MERSTDLEWDGSRIDRVAKAIFDAEITLTGDMLGDLIYQSPFINGPKSNAMLQTMWTCREVAIAVLKIVDAKE